MVQCLFFYSLGVGTEKVWMPLQPASGRIVELTLCPLLLYCSMCSSRWAACCDTLGRVLLVDVGACMVLRIFKGYRDAQAAWIVSPPLSDTTYSNQISSPEALLVLFAPKRGAVELWRAHAGVKLGSVPVATQRGLLLQQPALPVVPSGAEQRGPGWKEHRPNACWLLDLEALELVELTSQLGELAGKGGR